MVSLISAQKCVKFNCATTGDCADFVWATKTATLNPCTDANKVCDVQITDFNTWVADTKRQCKDKPTVVPTTSKRYPGEKCDTNNTCFNGTCGTDGKCPKTDKEQDCTSDDQCLVGYYCSRVTIEGKKTCVAQVAINGACDDTNQCVNSATCAKGAQGKVCTKYYSLADKSELTNLSEASACKLGETANFTVDSITKIGCNEAKYDDGVKPDATSGLVKCDAGTTCNYLDSWKAKYTQACQCNFDKDGQGYCPVARGDATLKSGDYFQKLSDIYAASTKCHTLNRGAACYETETATANSSAQLASAASIAKSFYWNWSDCFTKMFGSFKPSPSGSFSLSLTLFSVLAFIVYMF